MQAFYFRIVAYQRRQIKWVVEFSDLSRVAKFLLDTESHRVKSHSDCSICVFKSLVGFGGTSSDVLLEIFDADLCETLRQKALKIKNDLKYEKN